MTALLGWLWILTAAAWILAVLIGAVLPPRRR